MTNTTPTTTAANPLVIIELSFWKHILPAATTIIALWLGIPYVAALIYKGDLEYAALSGDMFGSVNSLFAGLAFAGVIISVILQRQDLRITKATHAVAIDDQHMTKEILGKQQDALKAQEDNIKEQQKMARKAAFEATFFQMFRTFCDATDAFVVVRSNETVSAKQSAGHMLTNLMMHINTATTANRTYEITKDIYDESYNEFFRMYGYALGHYFRLLNSLLKFIDRSGMDDPQFYAKIVRAQMSDNEANLLMMNWFSPFNPNPHFNSLVSKYKMLKHADPNVDTTEGFLCNNYDELFLDAFGSRRPEIEAKLQAAAAAYVHKVFRKGN